MNATARTAPRAGAAAAEQATAAAVDFGRFEQYVLALQERILSEAEQLDGSGKKFLRDRWSRGNENAGGLRVLGGKGWS